MTNYRLRIGTETRQLYYKPYNKYINQLVYVYKNKKNTAGVELSMSDIILNQETIDELQIALNRAKRDSEEMVWYDYWKTLKKQKI